MLPGNEVQQMNQLIIKRLSPIKLIVVILAIFLASTTIACEPGDVLYIVNRTDQVLKVTNSGNFVAEIAPGVEIQTIYLTSSGQAITIMATNPQGETIYSEKFNGTELFNMGGRVIISPSHAFIGGASELIIYNQELLDITITINGHFIAKVTSHKNISVGYEKGNTKYLIEVKNVNGQIIYSKEYTGNELQQLEGKITIP